MALAPCLLGYGEIASRLYADPNTKREGNIYWKWIENYVADDYLEAVKTGSGEYSIAKVVASRKLTAGKVSLRDMRLCSPQVDWKNW